MSNTGISDKVLDKLKEITGENNDLDMIIELLETEKFFSYESNPQGKKKKFALLLDQYFPLGAKNDQ